MSELAARLKVLTEVTARKRGILTQILAVCENQHMLFSQPPGEERLNFLREIGAEKQRLIDETLALDDVFQSGFDQIHDQLEPQKAAHMPAIQALQDEIRATARLDAKIRAQEEATRIFVASVSGTPINGEKPKPTVTAGQIIDKYKKHAKNP